MEKLVKNLVLIGFMAAGKSTIGRQFAQLNRMHLIDLDDVVTQQCGRTIPEIFDSEGEACFRSYETAALTSLLGQRNLVVATGGGIVCRKENWPLMRALGPTVYLQCDWKVLQGRLAAGSGRPLAADADWERIYDLYRSRLPLYEQADFIVNTENFSPSEIAENISTLVRGKQC